MKISVNLRFPKINCFHRNFQDILCDCLQIRQLLVQSMIKQPHIHIHLSENEWQPQCTIMKRFNHIFCFTFSLVMCVSWVVSVGRSNWRLPFPEKAPAGKPVSENRPFPVLGKAGCPGSGEQVLINVKYSIRSNTRLHIDWITGGGGDEASWRSEKSRLHDSFLTSISLGPKR